MHTQSARALLRGLGFATLHDREQIQRMIFHRPPTFVLDGVIVLGNAIYVSYFPSAKVFKGHAPKGVGAIHPGWTLGEFASQAGLVLSLFSEQFLTDPELESFKSIPTGTVRGGSVEFTERPVRKGEIVLFRSGGFSYQKAEGMSDRWRQIEGKVIASVFDPKLVTDSTQQGVVDVAEYGISGPICFSPRLIT